MRRSLQLLAGAALLLSGCSGVVTKTIFVTASPPDATIRVVSGEDLREHTFSSPARIRAEVPTDPARQRRAVLEVRRDDYLPKTIALRDLADGQTLNISLEKVVKEPRYRLSYRLLSPAASPDLRFRDKFISVVLGVAEQWFQLSMENVGVHEVKVLWDRSEYTDTNNRLHRLMHSGIKYPDRNNPAPSQIIAVRGAVQQAVIPIDRVVYAQQKKAYEVLPLFAPDSEPAAGLKGKTMNLFIPVEIDRQIIPYNFKIEVTDAVREDGR